MRRMSTFAQTITNKKFMKKSFLAVAVILGSTTLFAQDLTSKKGEAYLPVAGDWAISVDATPILNYVGNFIGGNGLNSAPTWNFLHPSSAIIGKYFVEDNMAYRGGVNIMFGTLTERQLVGKVGSTTGEQVEDSKKTSGSGIYLTGGMEWRKGSTRLQGFYGAELGLGFGGGTKEEYTFGNTYDFTTNPSMMHGVDGTVDVQSHTTKGGIMFGLRGFIGAEYFVLPKLAIGGEFGWGLGLQTMGEESEVVMQVNSAGTALEEKTNILASKRSEMNLGTDNMNSVFGPSGTLRISFHF